MTTTPRRTTGLFTRTPRLENPTPGKLAGICVAATVLIAEAVTQTVLAMHGVDLGALQIGAVLLGYAGGSWLFVLGHCSMQPDRRPRKAKP